MLKKISPYIIEKVTLGGRSAGRDEREKIIRYLEESPEDTVLPLDFSKVTLIDYSCSDELICKLVRRVSTGEFERYVVLMGLSDGLKENIDMALKFRESACIVIEGGQPNIIGDIRPEMKETYFLAVTMGKITSKDLVDQGKVEKINAASNRLTRLQEMGLVCKCREEAIKGGGRQFVYEPVK